MQRVQSVALALFAQEGFGPVSIEAIARAADVGVATIFRHFGTKDRIVLWDEAEEAATENLLDAIQRDGALPAVLEFASQLDEADAQFRLRVQARLALIQREPELGAQAALNLLRLGDGISKALCSRRRRKLATLRDKAAGQAIAAALTAAILEWGRLRGRRSMRVLAEEALLELQTAISD